jgi:hypothetical protein
VKKDNNGMKETIMLYILIMALILVVGIIGKALGIPEFKGV